MTTTLRTPQAKQDNGTPETWGTFKFEIIYTQFGSDKKMYKMYQNADELWGAERRFEDAYGDNNIKRSITKIGFAQ